MFNAFLEASIDKAAIDWVNTVQANGGSTPSGNTVRALSNFMRGLRGNGLINKMKSVNCFAPDDLVAVRTPVYKITGNSVWTNTGFVSGDVTTSGLKSNGSKYLNTGINPSSSFTFNNIGASFYFTDSGSTTGHAYGCTLNNYSTDFVGTAYVGSISGVHFDAYNTSTAQGRLLASTTSFIGWISQNRLSSTDARIYYRKTGIGVTQAGSITTGGGTPPNTSNLVLYNSWNNTAIGAFGANIQMSFFAFHDGLTLAESTTLCSLVETMRKSLGGGYVAT